MKRVQKRRERTRAGLLEAAHELMSEQGIEPTTIQQITAKADVGFGTFYNYFSSKEDIAEKVLDCVIHNLGSRNRLANVNASISDPVAVIAFSVRLTAREMLTNPMWHWWVRRTDLMVRRMNAGFRRFGLADIASANASGALDLPHDNADASWSYLIWLLAGTVTDLLDSGMTEDAETIMAQSIMRVMGIDSAHSLDVARAPLPPYPDLPLDFTFMLDTDVDAAVA